MAAGRRLTHGLRCYGPGADTKCVLLPHHHFIRRRWVHYHLVGSSGCFSPPRLPPGESERFSRVRLPRLGYVTGFSASIHTLFGPTYSWSMSSYVCRVGTACGLPVARQLAGGSYRGPDRARGPTLLKTTTPTHLTRPTSSLSIRVESHAAAARPRD